MAELVAFSGLPQALARLCLRDGRQRKEIAEAAGINASMLSGFLNGRRTPSLEHLDRLLAEMGFTVDDLAHELREVGSQSAKAPLVRWQQSLNKPEAEAATAILTTLLESMQALLKDQQKGGAPKGSPAGLPKRATRTKARGKPTTE